MKDLSRKISLLCPVCGNDLFESLDDSYNDESLDDAPNDILVCCSDCKSHFTKEELLEANSEIVQNTIHEIEKEAIEEIEKELRKALRK